MYLRDLFLSIDVLNYEDIFCTDSFSNIDVLDISFNSKSVKPGSVFVCLEGSKVDGHTFAKDAVASGAVCVVASKSSITDDLPGNIPVVLVKNTRKTLADISANFFKHPAEEIKVIGVTGTKGKTTTSFMVSSVLNNAGIKCGIISTLGIFMDDLNLPAVEVENTTPESYYVQKYLRKMADAGFKCVVLEASSIGLKQHRLDGIYFECAVFTNFSEDHIGKGEHKTEQEYLECKSLLFKRCASTFINLDDEKSEYILENCKCNYIKSFGVNNKKASLLATNIELINNNNSFGTSFVANDAMASFKVKLSVLGKFNVYNALAAILVAKHLGVDNETIRQGLASTKVKGRMELLPVPLGFNFKILIDYAHNAASMQSLLSTLKEYNPARLVVIFGSGGNRPKIRRFQLGKSSGKFADVSILTEDNSRFENTLDIIKDIETGIRETGGKYMVIPNRREAIKYAIFSAKPGDFIVLAGKGHEEYIEKMGEKFPFNEREVVKSILDELAENHKKVEYKTPSVNLEVVNKFTKRDSRNIKNKDF